MEFNRKVLHIFKYQVTKYLISQYVIRQSSSTINTFKKTVISYISKTYVKIHQIYFLQCLYLRKSVEQNLPYRYVLLSV